MFTDSGFACAGLLCTTSVYGRLHLTCVHPVYSLWPGWSEGVTGSWWLFMDVNDLHQPDVLREKQSVCGLQHVNISYTQPNQTQNTYQSDKGLIFKDKYFGIYNKKTKDRTVWEWSFIGLMMTHIIFIHFYILYCMCKQSLNTIYLNMFTF